jgi:hypothetical protein
MTIMIGEVMLFGAIGGAALFLAMIAFVTIEESFRH